MDGLMVLLLAVIFGLFYAFAQWCDRVIDEGGKEES